MCCRLHGKSKTNKTKVKPKGSDDRIALDGITLAGYQCWGNVALADSGVEIQWADSGKTKVMVLVEREEWVLELRWLLTLTSLNCLPLGLCGVPGTGAF